MTNVRTRRRAASLLGGALLLLVGGGATAHPSAEHEIDALSQEIAAHPRNPRHYIDRGSAYTSEGRYELALADFRKAEVLGSAELVAFDLGVLYQRKGEIDSARRYFDAFLAAFPGHAPALEHRARLLRDAGETEAALADFEALFAAQAHPNPGSYLSAARLLADGGADGVDPALAMLDRGMSRLGVIPQLQREAVALELKRGSTSAAVARLESLRPALGSSPSWKIELAELLLRVGRQSDAEALLAEASSQLESLRETPARRAEKARLAKLRAVSWEGHEHDE